MKFVMKLTPEMGIYLPQRSRRRDNMTAKGILIGILIGGIVGATTALLLAPMEGAEARRRISHSSKCAAERVGKAADSMKDCVTRQHKTVQQAI